PFPIGLVAQVRDALDRLFAHQLRDALDQTLLVDLIRNLSDDNRLLVAFLRVLALRARANGDRAAAITIRLHDAGAPDDGRAGGEVGTGNYAEQAAQAGPPAAHPVAGPPR